MTSVIPSAAFDGEHITLRITGNGSAPVYEIGVRDVARLQQELASIMSTLMQRLTAADSPFVCGQSTTLDKDGMPEILFVCPAHGVDGLALYRKASDYSAPGY